MGGREFSQLTEGLHGAVTNLDAAAVVIESRSILVPPVGDTGGPFAGRPIEGPRGPKPRSDEEEVARASLYLALMTDYCFDLINAKGPVVVEGSLIGNNLFLSALSELRRPETLLVSSDATGTVSGAVQLAGAQIPDSPNVVAPLELPIEDYRRVWREALPA
jgi:hypothetical protein